MVKFRTWSQNPESPWTLDFALEKNLDLLEPPDFALKNILDLLGPPDFAPEKSWKSLSLLTLVWENPGSP